MQQSNTTAALPSLKVSLACVAAQAALATKRANHQADYVSEEIVGRLKSLADASAAALAQPINATMTLGMTEWAMIYQYYTP